MKNLKAILLAAASVALVSSCNNDPGSDPTPQPSAIVDFEAANLLATTGGNTIVYNNILWGMPQAELRESGDSTFDGVIYTEDGASFGNYYSDGLSWGSKNDSWGGVTISSNTDTSTTTVDYATQFAARGASATKFAVLYDFGGWNGSQYERPFIAFDEPVTVLSMDVANSSVAYCYCTTNPKGVQNLKFTVVATGYKGGTERGSLNIVMADGADILSGWRNVDFTTLGEVDTIKFTMESNDNDPSFGNNVPAYACIDNIAIK